MCQGGQAGVASVQQFRRGQSALIAGEKPLIIAAVYEGGHELAFAGVQRHLRLDRSVLKFFRKD